MEKNQTTGAAIVVAETPKKPSTKRSALPAIQRRKVLMGKHQKTGAPKLDVIGLTIKPCRGPFTLKDIFSANGETISLLTIKKRKNELMKAGKLVKDAEAAKQQHEGTGRPPEYFNFDTAKGEAKKSRIRKMKPVVVAEPQDAVEAPAIEQAQAPVIEEQPAAPAPVVVPVEPAVVA